MRVATGAVAGPNANPIPPACEPRLLDDPSSSRLVCAPNENRARAAFRAQVRNECGARCEPQDCASDPGCRPKKHTPTSVGEIVCTETGNPAGCPPHAGYVRQAKEFSCVAEVVCNCECG